MKFLFNIILILLVSGVSAQSSEFTSIISSATKELTTPQVVNLLALSASKSWNAFDLLNELANDLHRRRLRIEISGEALRGAGKIYRLGDHRVFALFPVAKVQKIKLGFTSDPEKTPALEIFLKEPHADFLELGDFSLLTYYGFRISGEKKLDRAFGAQVKNGIFTLNLEKIERVPDPTGGINPNFIAIHVQMFFRPKRWHIDPIRLWIPGEQELKD